MLRFFHTSDWHLGQLFFNHSRHEEHEQFLDWLLDQLQQKQPHALLIAGDVFDVVNPSTGALKQFNRFLAAAHQRVPHLQILVIAGNHDSGPRLEQVEPLLTKYNTHVVGTISWNHNKQLQLDKLLIPIKDQQSQIIAWCIALPFLRPAEITASGEHYQHAMQATEQLYQLLLDEAEKRKTPDQALILMTHAHMTGGTSSDSERPIIIGNSEALSTQLFSSSSGLQPDYVALGHLHRPQQIEHPHIRYSGSPIPLSFSELTYKHQVIEVNLRNNLVEIEPLYIPRTVALIKIRQDLENTLKEIRQLPALNELSFEKRPFLDIEYFSDAPPPPDLRQQIEQLLPTNSYRLVSLRRAIRQAGTHPDPINNEAVLIEPPTPLELFSQLWQQQGFEQDLQVIQDFKALQLQAETSRQDEAQA